MGHKKICQGYGIKGAVAMKVVLENLTKRFPSRNKKGEDVIAVNNNLHRC